jgi:hypothetical protein
VEAFQQLEEFADTYDKTEAACHLSSFSVVFSMFSMVEPYPLRCTLTTVNMQHCRARSSSFCPYIHSVFNPIMV